MPDVAKKDPALQECEETLAAADKALKELENNGSVNGEEDEESTASQVNELEPVHENDEEDEYESIAAMKQRIKEMEMEAKKIEEMQTLAESRKGSIFPANGPEADVASIYVGNVDYSTRPEELQKFFSSCGAVQRVTILTDKWTGHPKGYAYVQFRSAEAVANAVLLNESEFKGRQLKVNEKRTNVPGYSRGGYGSYRGGYRGGNRGQYRGRYRGYRSRGWGSWAPY